MSLLIPTLHTIATEHGTIKVVETPITRVYGDPYPGVYLPDGNVFWEVRYDLFEQDEEESYRYCTLIVPCGRGWQSAPPDVTLRMMVEDADTCHTSTPEEMAMDSGADLSVEAWQEIFNVWRGWHRALGEFFGKYYRDVRYDG